jgi:putative ABC transport system substrate-binding protein
VKRREFITLLVGAAATWPRARLIGVAFAQSNERVRLGYLWVGAEGSDGQTLSGVRQGLADVGLVEGRNLVLERRYADSHPERLNALAMELVRLDVAVLLAPGAVVTRAMRSATGTIPIVSVTNDPVALGFAQTLAHPGGNVTGMAITASDQLVEKWVELLKDVTPPLKRAALLYDPRPAPMIERVAHDASVTIGIEIIPFRVTDAEELGAALAAIEMARPDGLLINNDALLLSDRSNRKSRVGN